MCFGGGGNDRPITPPVAPQAPTMVDQQVQAARRQQTANAAAANGSASTMVSSSSKSLEPAPVNIVVRAPLGTDFDEKVPIKKKSATGA